MCKRLPVPSLPLLVTESPPYFLQYCSTLLTSAQSQMRMGHGICDATFALRTVEPVRLFIISGALNGLRSLLDPLTTKGAETPAGKEQFPPQLGWLEAAMFFSLHVLEHHIDALYTHCVAPPKREIYIHVLDL